MLNQTIHRNRRRKTIPRETIILPRDVVCHILKKLPVKDLVRFKCVSKDWHSLVNDPYFIKLHLEEATKRNNNNINIIIKDDTSGKLFSAGFDYVNLDNPRDLNHPLTYRNSENTEEIVDYTAVMGSCNGLLCLVNEKYKTNTIVLWNMSTGDHKFLPDLPVVEDYKVSPYGTVCEIFYGFGYDSITEDYKVVRIVQERDKMSQIKVYSLKANTWSSRSSEDIPNNCYITGFTPTWKKGGTLLSGALHWVVTKKPGYSSWIIAFDVGSEKYHEIELLDHMKDWKFYPEVLMDLGVLGGCLCMSASGSHADSSVLYRELWMMKEYGVKESWTVLFRVEPMLYGVSYLLYPVAYSKNYDKILLAYYWYHIQGDEHIPIVPPLVNLAQLGGRDYKKFVPIPQLENKVDPIFSGICIESLVQLGD
ncbi:hypothetical protein PTKIN_Ptkin01aG0014400 [Pterospermum kingtungense]